MKKLLVILLLLAFGVYASTNAPTRRGVDGDYQYEMARIWTPSSGDSIILDTLDGADSVRLMDNFGPRGGWEYVLQSGYLSGDSAANTIVQVVVKSYTNVDSLLASDVVDTIAASNRLVVIPFGQTLFGQRFDVWLKSLNASDETVFENMIMWRRRIKQSNTFTK